MAENHASTNEHQKHMEAHRQTYHNFVVGTIIGTIACLYVLLGLAAVAFNSWGTLICWAGLIYGSIALFIDAKGGSGKWTLSIAGLLIFALIDVLSV
jgi:hypothetical protein